MIVITLSVMFVRVAKIALARNMPSAFVHDLTVVLARSSKTAFPAQRAQVPTVTRRVTGPINFHRRVTRAED